MKIEKIKPIPKYILKLIQKADKTHPYYGIGYTRFYSYLTKNDGELARVVVSVKNCRKKWYYKQVAVHGIHSKTCFIKDITFYYLYGNVVGWYEQGLQKYPKCYENVKWDYGEEKYFDPYAPVVNREYLNKFPEYKYSAVELYKYADIFKYLRYYEEFPQIEYLMKAGLSAYAFSKQILRKIGKDKRFCKWLIKNREEITNNGYYVDVILRSFRTGKPLTDLQAYREYRMKLLKEAELSELRTFFRKDIEKFVMYLRKQGTNPYSYRDYLNACQNLGLDMRMDKNRYPHDFKRWHDIRIDEYNTLKLKRDEEKRKEFYAKFAAVANKYLNLEYNDKSAYMSIIAKNPSELIIEGEALDHCVGRMNYDQKFAREETLIFFIRNISSPDIPFVTVEYSLEKHKILQCYGYHDTKPDTEVLYYVNKIWLPYANRKVRKIQKAA